ncbi:hypothetical protein SAMN02746089_02775 [Caldanaerobius fijiensis DSM 17918]|uniref:Uncharacterized protein n=1 Tax=Caldanaerobius fijiensis DSM 17918 TaxID=1121256 RepID=A0A1M5FL82_9THEO|nr:hypothetical protein [Caldanaerobius fijiensis]SHF92253.1 hypothetical protein SAMN02746089_02775 [Caldanaerobius fijiensis DSM 17918]
MRRKLLITVVLSVVLIGLIGGMALAKGTNSVALPKNPVNTVNQTKDIRQNNYGYENMIEIMKENGLTDMANLMEKGDFKGMDKLMENLSDADYQKMIKIMRDNGYGNMAAMMESIGKNGMIEMHKAMEGMHSWNSGMMGGF